MLRAILGPKQNQILKDEREALERLLIVLAGCDANELDLRTIEKSIQQLGELFLLVVVGEFNSGKSAFINALLGEQVFTEGVTPTTSHIHILQHSDENTRKNDSSGIIRIGHSVAFLRDINIVDTPGTNAINREHEHLTRDFVPRSDLVIFVTSADRPFTESERAFMEIIREWGKKVIIVLNKSDLLQTSEVAQVVNYIKDNTRQLLGFVPEIFPLSSRLAQQAKQAANQSEKGKLWADSNFESVEHYILKTLDEKSRVHLKLSNPLGVGEQLVKHCRTQTRNKLALVSEDLKAIDNIDSQMDIYKTDMQHDFRYRLSDVEIILLAMNNRGMQFFDDTVRLGRVFDLVNTSRIKSDYERQVVAETPQAIEREVQGMIDWMVDRDIRQWQTTLDYLDNHLDRLHKEQDKIIGKVGGNFANNRKILLESVGRAARDVMKTYDRESEARKLAIGLRDALAGSALVEVGAVSLGIILVSVLNTALLDFTGILAAGSLAVIGLLILPAKKRRAKNALVKKLNDLQDRLSKAMVEEFDRELDRSIQRLCDTIGPYTRFVRTEQQKLTRIADEISKIEETFKQLREKLDKQDIGWQ